MNLFNNDSFLGRILDRVSSFVLLNLYFMICALPVITAGASLTALYYSVLKLHKDGEVSVTRLFFRSFRQNLKQATAGWLLMLLLLLTAWLEHRFFPQGSSPFGFLFSISILILLFVDVILFLYLFPVIAAFSNSLKALLLHAFYFAFHKIGYLIAVVAITFLPMYFTLVDARMFPLYLLFWLLCGFSVTAWLNAWFFYRLFRPHLGGQDAAKASDSTPDSYVF